MWTMGALRYFVPMQSGFFFGFRIIANAGWKRVTLAQAGPLLASLDEDFEGSQLARDLRAGDFLTTLKSHEGVRCDVTESGDTCTVTGHLATWFEYCLLVEGLLLLLAAAAQAGGEGRGALAAAHDEVDEYPILQTYVARPGSVTVTKHEFEDLDEDETRSLLADHALESGAGL